MSTSQQPSGGRQDGAGAAGGAHKPASTPHSSRKSGNARLPSIMFSGEVIGRRLEIHKRRGWEACKVLDYDTANGMHRIRFTADKKEDWLLLPDCKFRWTNKPPADAKCNPTWKGGPIGEEALGRKVRVYWTGMRKWYQGFVKSYNARNDMHRVHYRDGDDLEHQLKHEACVFLVEEATPGTEERTHTASSSRANGTSDVKGSSPSCRDDTISSKPSKHSAGANGSHSAVSKPRAPSVTKQRLPAPSGGSKRDRATPSPAAAPLMAAAAAAAASTAGAGSSHAAPRARPSSAKAAGGSHAPRKQAAPPALATGMPSQLVQPHTPEPSPVQPASSAAATDANAAAGAEMLCSTSRVKHTAAAAPTPGSSARKSSKRAADAAAKGDESSSASKRRKPLAAGVGRKQLPAHQNARHNGPEPRSSLVGCRIGIWWDGDKMYFRGTLCAHNASSGKFQVSAGLFRSFSRFYFYL